MILTRVVINCGVLRFYENHFHVGNINMGVTSVIYITLTTRLTRRAHRKRAPGFDGVCVANLVCLLLSFISHYTQTTAIAM
jgi:hypothetical protein